ncbi:FtsX-like permease family protein [Streptomyces polyrhachis]|uniref:FtsX-like permease family protein n=1 Tax=Streptomyces polyrhachis TaxID=1282885 RepID=A0ABW2GDR2_9ACTN
MSAVWQAARAAVRRRRLQTLVIWLVTLVSTGVLVVALGLVDAASAPFDRAFAQQRGAHVTASFDRADVTDGQLAATARRPGVAAASGPFPQADVELPREVSSSLGLDSGLRVVGRPGPGGPVDRVELLGGRWARGPGEIVLRRDPNWGLDDLGARLQVPGGPRLTVVGFAHSLSRTAEAWVAPEQIGALHPKAVQMLYRFDRASTAGELRASVGEATAGLPAGSLVAQQSYLALKEQIGATARAFAPYLLAFGVLGMAVSVLIVANVVSGAVISGFRRIGVLKSLGFTPNQVVGVYLTMIGVPAGLGCLLGAGAGNLLAGPLLEFAFQGPDAGVLHGAIGISPRVNAVALLGMPAVVLLAALLPALRAHRLPAARAISAGSAPAAGRALRIQRGLAGSRLPRPVSLGLGLPFARPGRSALTMAAVVLGVTTVTFATGLAATMTRMATAEDVHARDVTVYATALRGGKEVKPAHDPAELQSLLGSLPGAAQVVAQGFADVRIEGMSEGVVLDGRRGPDPTLGQGLVSGRWMRGPHEVVAPSAFLERRGLQVGDTVRLRKGEHELRVRMVGQELFGDGRSLYANWPAVTSLSPAEEPNQYHVRLTAGADPARYAAAARAADHGVSTAVRGPNAVVQTIVGSASGLTLMLAVVAALGVFNTVVLNTRDRRRDLGMLKSIGMTPRQVTAMMVVSMAALGLVGGLLGLPLGVLGHALVMPEMAGAVGYVLPDRLMQVWQVWTLAPLALAGTALAALGAYIPARRAARLTIAEVLRSE